MTMLRCLAFAALLTAAALPAQAIRYAPGDYKYSVTTVIKQSQEMGDQKQGSTIGITQRMAVLLIARGADSLRFRTTLEDYTISADLPIQLPDVGKLKGTVVEGAMTAYGRVAHYSHRSPVTSGADVIALAENMSRFVLALSPNAAKGYTWTDTASTHNKNDGGELSERTVTTTLIDGDTVVAGVKAWRIRRHTTVTVKGMTVQDGASLPITSDGDGTGTFCISLQGVYLGAHTANASVTTIQLPTGGIVKQTSSSDVAIALLK
jgi:hypothetical protein